MRSTVSIVPCPEYEAKALDRAVAEAVELAGGFEARGAVVLLKPNLLNANGPERGVTVHPAIVAAAVRWLKVAGASRVLVGDSPGWQTQELVGRKTGVKDAVLQSGGEWADFSTEAEFELPEGRLARRFRLAAPLAEADLLVSLPKLKTHQLMYYTGAVKNLFGLVPGLQKSAFHLRFPGRGEFAGMLSDLALASAPDFSLMDAIVAMEGPGPNNGRPRSLGLVLASRDPLALDWTAAGLIGYEPGTVPYLADLMGRMAAKAGDAARPERGPAPESAREPAEDGARNGGRDEAPEASRRRAFPSWAASPAEIVLAGLPLAEAKPEGFDLVPLLKENDFLSKKLPPWLHRLVKGAMVPRPRFDHGKCVRCSGCVRICPAKALVLAPSARDPRGRIEIDYERCIRCYCCHEICPEDAIDLVRRWL